MHSQAIIYEQPLNEHIRVCLRLEHLFSKIEFHLQEESVWNIRQAISTLLDILDVADRPDIKSKLVNIIRQHESTLTQLERLPNVDRPKLRNILDQLEDARHNLHETQGKIGQGLRENEFLATIRQRMNVPGGTSNFAIPAYHLWLEQSHDKLTISIKEWLSTFDKLKHIITLILKLTRESSNPATKMAYHGFYQEALPPDAQYQLIRVAIPMIHNHYPEISVGRHRLSIHFYTLNVSDRPIQTNNDLEFELTYCKA
ncbi:MAG: cell division protein ZapD [Gammaproteobacteria bacterium]|nr:cell division protein ZapD [Gammaproteobacteria bacterium]